MSMAMYMRSPRARLAIRALGPFLMLLFWEIILSRVAFPMIPTANITQDSTVLMYLKAVWIDVACRQLGGDIGRIRTAREELEEGE